jgi:dihydrofolate reductase
MTKVTYDMSMSLDGFVTAAGRTAEEPLGRDGERLHGWAFGGDERDRAILAEGVGGIGAVITGRRNYDDSVPWWGPDGPTGPERLPVFVVTHRLPDTSPDGGVYTFVTGGIDQALDQAKVAAGDKGVCVMGGPDIGRQYLEAGLVDEISVHVVPVLFGAGTPMFGDLGSHVTLVPRSIVQTAQATHLRYAVST